MNSEEYTRNLKLPLLVPNQSGKEFTHNEALIIIDSLIHNVVIDILNTPPTELNVGNKYIIGANAGGDFKNKENQIAIYDENGWKFVEVQNGYFVWVINHSSLYIFENNIWKILDISDKRIKVTEPKTNEILKYDGLNFINSNSLSNIEQLSIISNLIVKDADKLSKFRLEVNENGSDINVSNNGVNWLKCISIDNSSGKVDFGTDITIKGDPITSGNSLIEIRENYDITEASILEFTNLELNCQHKFVITSLTGSSSSTSHMFCNIGYDSTYIETDYCWESLITNSGESYSYVKNKNKTNSYQITSDKYTDSGIKNIASANIEFYIDPSNSAEKFMSCIVKVATNYSSLKYYKTVSSCLVYNDNQINKIKFFLANGNFMSGSIKHYIIK